MLTETEIPAYIETRLKQAEDKLAQFKSRQQKDQISIIVFSGDLDKVLAAMIIANGARAMDTEVKMFFTFWGTTMLRDKYKKGKNKSFISKLFGFMLPKGSSALKLSKLNMGGLGTQMMKGLMRKNNVASLEELIATAGELGVQIYVCQMSLDLMGITKNELIDYPNLSYCGVGSYLSDADESRVQLFI